MAIGNGSFRSRAASLLRPSTPVRISVAEKSLADPALNEKASGPGEHEVGRPRSPTTGESGYHFSTGNVISHDRDAQRIVRTVPAWVHTLDEDDDSIREAPLSFLETPPGVQVAQHNTTPFVKFRRKNLLRSDSPRGRLYDSQREWTTPLPREHISESGSRWRAFADASAYPRLTVESGQIVTEEWLEQNGADYSRPWLADAENGDLEKGQANVFRFRAKRRAWYLRLQRTLLRNPILPMIIRLNVFTFSAVALALASSMHHLTDKSKLTTEDLPQSTPSTDMAIIVDAVAMVYLLYITWDEYSGKPLGLRSARAKMRLIFLDLFFIVFDSANLSLAFDAIKAAGHCSKSVEKDICVQQKALASVLLVALIAWLLTFSISVMRVVERVTTR